MRTLARKLQACKRHLHEMKEQNAKLQRTNRVLLQEKESLLKKIISLEKTNNELRDFIGISVVKDFDLNDGDDLLEAWEEPRSPGSLSSQRTMVKLTPKKTCLNPEQREKTPSYVKFKMNNEEMTRYVFYPGIL